MGIRYSSKTMSRTAKPLRRELTICWKKKNNLNSTSSYYTPRTSWHLKGTLKEVKSYYS